jgi:hypothetical protein
VLAAIDHGVAEDLGGEALLSAFLRAGLAPASAG